MSEPLSYREAGVDIDAGDALVEAIKPFAKRTLRPEVLAGLGGFGALCAIPKKYRELIAIAVACTTQCPFCIEAHAKGAKAAGATREEVVEASLLAAALKAGGAATHGTMALKFFDKE